MASIVFEVECEVEGNVTPAEPDVGIMGPGVEDADLSSVSMLVAHRGDRGRIWRYVDLLEGLSKESRDIVINNIMAAYRGEIEEVILSDA